MIRARRFHAALAFAVVLVGSGIGTASANTDGYLACLSGNLAINPDSSFVTLGRMANQAVANGVPPASVVGRRTRGSMNQHAAEVVVTCTVTNAPV